jgi:hypothetical protein
VVLSVFGYNNKITPFFCRVNGSHEERSEALLEDSAAFGIGTTTVGLVQFVLGVLSISLLNYAAQQQVSFKGLHTSQELSWVIF